MALIKSIETDFGIPATYWRIEHFTFHRDGNVDVTLHGYANAGAKDKQPMASWQATIDARETRASIYEALKMTDYWEGAEDDLV